MTAVERAPAANWPRRRFGIRNAMVKASMRRPPPKSAAKICSRARPRMRLHRTARPTMPAAFVFSFSAFAAAAAGGGGVPGATTAELPGGADGGLAALAFVARPGEGGGGWPALASGARPGDGGGGWLAKTTKARPG